MKKVLIIALFVGLCLTSFAQHRHGGHGRPGGYGYRPAPPVRYYHHAPRPYYYAPRPYYYAPRPYYYAPAPVYYPTYYSTYYPTYYPTYYGYGRGCDGVNLATSIVNLVGASANLLTPRTVIIEQR